MFESRDRVKEFVWIHEFSNKARIVCKVKRSKSVFCKQTCVQIFISQSLNNSKFVHLDTKLQCLGLENKYSVRTKYISFQHCFTWESGLL